MKAVSIIIKLILPIVVVIGGVIGWKHMKELTPRDDANKAARVKTSFKLSDSERKQQREEGIPVVAHPLDLQSYQVYLTSRGTAVAGEDLTLTAEAEGKVTYLAEEFEVGSVVERGAVIMSIDDADLQDNLIVAQAQVAQSEAALAQEQARAEQAQINWDELGYAEAPSDLVLRKPQLRQAQANVEAAVARVELAQRQLERAKLRAPFTGMVVERTITLGERATRGKAIGRLVGADYSTIRLQIPPNDQLFLPTDLKGASVEFSNPLLPEASPTWSGYVMSRAPEVDPDSKQLTLITRVLDPYSLSVTTSETIPMGQPVSAKIKGKVLEKVYCVPKSALRGPNKIHLMSLDNMLTPLEVVPIITDRDNIVFHADLEVGTRWVQTTLPVWKEGRLLRLQQEDDDSEEVANKE